VSYTRSVRTWLDEITAELRDVAERPRREAELLLMAHLKCDQIWLITHQDDLVDNGDRLEKWVQRRQQHEPMEYITNKVSFYSQEFYIAPGALIPRPETELLIDRVLEYADTDKPLTIVEVGVGSGIISVILAQHLPHATIIAVDISADALRIARQNLERFDLEERVELRQGDLLDAVSEPIDILVSNPPYIANDAPLEKNLDYEPDTALFGGDIGDEIIQRLLDQAIQKQIPFTACEMGYDQQEKVSRYLEGRDGMTLAFYADLAKLDRGFTLIQERKDDE
jgi:release factor glutamine methyltransferase